MPGRMSNRDRIEQLRAEADAKAREKAAKQAERAARPPAARKSGGKSGKAPPPKPRVRLAWSVCDPSGKEVQQFPYAQEAEARAEAERRTQESGRTHFVTKAEVRVE